MTSRFARVKWTVLSAIVCGAASHLAAQSAPATSDAPKKVEEDPVVLSPFVVNAGDDRGYQAQQTLAGSRLKTDLKDIANPVSVFTEQFFLDTGISDTNELAKYMLNVEYNINENAGSTGTNQNLLNGNARSVRMRGLSGGLVSTNFFNTGGVADTYSVERIEQARGPNAILFGIGNPGGVVNSSTKRALLTRDRYNFAASLRSYDGTRMEFDANQVAINGRAAVRVAGVQARYGGWRNFEYRDVDGIFGTARFQLAKWLELNLEGERTNVNKRTSRTFTAIDYYTPWRDAGKVITTTDTANAAAGIARISASPWVVFDTATGTLANWRNKNTGAVKSVAGGADNPVLTDFSVMPKESTFYGPGYNQGIDNNRLSAYLTATPIKDLNMELAVMRLNEVRDTWDPQQNISWGLRVDPNAFLPLKAGQSTAEANPNAGRAYLEAQPQHDTAVDENKYVRFSANYTRDFGWLGKHTVGGVIERDTTRSDRASLREYIISSNAPTVVAATTTAANVNNRVFRRTYVDLTGPSENIVLADPQAQSIDGLTERTTGAVYRTAYIPHDANTRIISSELNTQIGMIQSSFWNDRIKTVVGASHDERTSYQSTQVLDPNVGGNGAIARAVAGTTPFDEAASNYSYSAVVRATDWLNLTFSKARNAGLAPQSGLLHSDTGRPPASRGNSRDIGARMSLLDNRVYVAVTYFETAADNDSATGTLVAATEVNKIWSTLNLAGVKDASGQVVSATTENTNTQTFSSASQGWEAEATANLTPNWRVLFSYSNTETVQTNIAPEMVAYLDSIKPFWLEADRGRLLLDGSGLAPVARDNDGLVETVAEQVDFIDQRVNENKTLAEGRSPIGQVKHKVRFLSNYDFTDGVLKGITVGGGVRYDSRPVIGFEQTLDGSGNLVKSITLGADQIFFDANIAYRRNLRFGGAKIAWSLQLNIDNLLDNDAYVTRRVNSAGSVTNYQFNAPRSWILTSRFSF